MSIHVPTCVCTDEHLALAVSTRLVRRELSDVLHKTMFVWNAGCDVIDWLRL